MGAFFFRGMLRNPLKKNRAFRCNSSDLPMQILWDFRFNPLRGRAAELFGNFSFRTTSPEKENLPLYAANSARLGREPRGS
jgi:hypothetical protein